MGLFAPLQHGAETLSLPGLKCRPGKHTVSYRYLMAQGNDKEMGVSAGGSTGRVAFKVGRYKVDSIKPRVGSAYGCSA